MDRAQRDFAAFTQRELPSLLAVNATREALRQLAAFDEVDVVMNYALPDEARRRAQEGLALLVRVQAQLRPLLSAPMPDQEKLARAAMTALQAYEGMVRPIFGQAAAGTLASVADGKRALDQVDARLEVAAQALHRLGQALDEATRTRVALIGERHAGASFALSVIAPCTVAFLFAVMQLSLWSIRVPLARAQRAAAAVAQGDLSLVIEDAGRDEIAELMHTLARMQQGLCDMVGAILNAAAQQALASREIAEGSLDLSQRTEQMASALVLSASGLQQLDEQMHSSVERAGAMRLLNADAARSTESGHAAMARLARSMQAIDASFTDIAAVTEVVDGIARRTNILALNAGVEAARAGEHGRGFGVVAAEVRALSIRVTDSARQIEQVIRLALPKVHEARDLALGTTDAMAHVLTTISQAAQGSGEIAEHIRQRSADTGDLTGAMRQLEGLTQQNAALVEQSAAAAAHLSDQAERLQALVSAFKLPPP